MKSIAAAMRKQMPKRAENVYSSALSPLENRGSTEGCIIGRRRAKRKGMSK